MNIFALGRTVDVRAQQKSWIRVEIFIALIDKLSLFVATIMRVRYDSFDIKAWIYKAKIRAYEQRTLENNRNSNANEGKIKVKKKRLKQT